MDNWQNLLIEAVQASTKKHVADQLGVSRSTISLIVNGKYPASSDHVAKRVLEKFGRIECPHLVRLITQTECHKNFARQAPNNSPREMKFWRACQVCPHKPMNQKNETQGDKS